MPKEGLGAVKGPSLLEGGGKIRGEEKPLVSYVRSRLETRQSRQKAMLREEQLATVAAGQQADVSKKESSFTHAS